MGESIHWANCLLVTRLRLPCHRQAKAEFKNLIYIALPAGGPNIPINDVPQYEDGDSSSFEGDAEDGDSDASNASSGDEDEELPGLKDEDDNDADDEVKADDEMKVDEDMKPEAEAEAEGAEGDALGE